MVDAMLNSDSVFAACDILKLLYWIVFPLYNEFLEPSICLTFLHLPLIRTPQKSSKVILAPFLDLYDF